MIGMGNVRELENAIERAMVVGKKNSIKVEDLPFHVSSNQFEENGDGKVFLQLKRNIY